MYLNIINYYNYIYYIGEEHVDSVLKRPRTDLEGLDEVPCQSTIQRKRPHDIIGMSLLRNILHKDLQYFPQDTQLHMKP